MTFFYNTAIILYWLGLHIAAPFHVKARKWVRGRYGVLRKLKHAMSNSGGRKVAWFHCASLGEFEQGRPIIEALRAQHPEYFILLTFFSPSGYEVRKNYDGVDYVCYMPLDLWWIARAFVRVVAPQIAIFIKYEFWYNYFKELKQQGVKTYVVSAIFDEEQAFFDRIYGSFFVKMLHSCEHIFVQTRESLALLAEVGISNASYSGDTRFDRVLTVAANANALPELSRFTDGKITLVAGSTWPPDEDLLAYLLKIMPDIKLIIAPHEVTEPRVQSLMAKFDKSVLRYTQWKENPNLDLASYNVFIVDAVGFLSSLYRFGTMAYIGGGFGVGIHNTLEAAVFGIPVIFGTNYKKFREAADLIAVGGAYSVASGQELLQLVGTLRVEENRYKKSCEASKQYVLQHKGATEIIVKRIEEDLSATA